MWSARVFGCMVVVSSLIIASTPIVTASNSKDCDEVINDLLEEFNLPDDVDELVSEVLDECPGWVPTDPFCVFEDFDGNCFPGVATNPFYTHAHASFVVVENEDSDDCTIEGVSVHVRAKLPFEYDWDLELNGVPEDRTDSGPFVREHSDTGDWIGEILQIGESISGSASVTNVDFPGDSSHASGSYTCGDGALQLLPELLT